ncbi:MAG: hypothetical protein HWN79_15245 [Candidatus Lokiarchaeota archaeon]|nr:hypothetical protein [Candidatus Lokiarchaeota archaeon]
MPYVVSFVRWPGESTVEMVKKAIEVDKKFPPDDSLGENLVTNAINADMDGIKSFSVTLVKPGKLEETILRARSILNMYLTIPGFKYSVETWATVEEAYTSIGQTPPG